MSISLLWDKVADGTIPFYSIGRRRSLLDRGLLASRTLLNPAGLLAGALVQYTGSAELTGLFDVVDMIVCF